MAAIGRALLIYAVALAVMLGLYPGWAAGQSNATIAYHGQVTCVVDTLTTVVAENRNRTALILRNHSDVQIYVGTGLPAAVSVHTGMLVGTSSHAPLVLAGYQGPLSCVLGAYGTTGSLRVLELLR